MNDTNKVRLANLEAVAEMRRAELVAARKPLNEAYKRVFAEVVAASGVSGYALSLNEKGEVYDFSTPELSGEIDGKRLHDIHCYFRNDRWDDASDEPRRLSFNTTCFGDVKVGDAVGVAYCVMVGYLASNLQSIQDALDSLPEWEAYRTAKRFFDAAYYEAEGMKRKMKEEARAEKEAAVLKRLVPEAVLAFDFERSWDDEKGEYRLVGVKTKTVEKVTPHFVFFKGDCRRYKKAYVLADILVGLSDGGWSFAEDIDMSQFPLPFKY